MIELFEQMPKILKGWAWELAPDGSVVVFHRKNVSYVRKFLATVGLSHVRVSMR